jgi:hypothetical protein
MNCLHCAKPFTDENPAHRDLLLHLGCFRAVGGSLPALPAHHTHGSPEVDALAQKVTYPADLPGQRGTHGCQYPGLPVGEVGVIAGNASSGKSFVKPEPLNALDLSLNETLVKLNISKTRIERSFDAYEFRRNGELIFTGNALEIWRWLRQQGEIV